MVLILSMFLVGCGNEEQDMQCAAVCMAEQSYTYTTELERYLFEASVSGFTQTETISFEYTGTEEEVYGESSGVIINPKSTGFYATVEYELSIENITINGQVVELEQTDLREKQECGGTCEAKSFSVSTDEISSLE